MNLQFKQARFELEQGQMLTLDDSLDVTIHSETGALWITQDGDPRDVTLSAGASYRIDRSSRVMVFATSPSAFRISSAPSLKSRMTSSRNPSFLERLIGASFASAKVVAAPQQRALESCPS